VAEEQNITFEKWLSLSEEEQKKIEATWNPNANGYWQNLLTQATEKFKKEFSSLSQIVGVTSGMYHGGTLIIGVTLNLPLGERPKEIPSRFAGFHVQQFWSSKHGLK
jgi:hypothetical protein